MKMRGFFRVMNVSKALSVVKLKPENKPFIFNTAQVVFITTKFILNSSLNIHSHPACGCP